jgi:hypothetical protein
LSSLIKGGLYHQGAQEEVFSDFSLGSTRSPSEMKGPVRRAQGQGRKETVPKRENIAHKRSHPSRTPLLPGSNGQLSIAEEKRAVHERLPVVAEASSARLLPATSSTSSTTKEMCHACIMVMRALGELKSPIWAAIIAGEKMPAKAEPPSGARSALRCFGGCGDCLDGGEAPPTV